MAPVGAGPARVAAGEARENGPEVGSGVLVGEQVGRLPKLHVNAFVAKTIALVHRPSMIANENFDPDTLNLLA